MSVGRVNTVVSLLTNSRVGSVNRQVVMIVTVCNLYIRLLSHTRTQYSSVLGFV